MPGMKTCSSEFLQIRGRRLHVRIWGSEAAPLLVLLHGWCDVSASWQFVVDALERDWRIVAPDWRGFGLSEGNNDAYWFPDYMADLDALLDHYAGERKVDLVGHSMGGNIAMMYAGVRPQRMEHLVNLEGFGMPETRPAQAPGRYAQWMDEIKTVQRGGKALKSYADADGVARRLMKTNPRLAQDKADWLARQWAAPNAQGEWDILGDAAHKVTSAHIYRLDEALEIYRRISAPVLSVTASDDSLGQWWKGSYTLAQYLERIRAVPRLQSAVVQEAGHMVHHDQPAELARLIEAFLATAR